MVNARGKFRARAICTSWKKTGPKKILKCTGCNGQRLLDINKNVTRMHSWGILDAWNTRDVIWKRARPCICWLKTQLCHIAKRKTRQWKTPTIVYTTDELHTPRWLYNRHCGTYLNANYSIGDEEISRALTHPCTSWRRNIFHAYTRDKFRRVKVCQTMQWHEDYYVRQKSDIAPTFLRRDILHAVEHLGGQVREEGETMHLLTGKCNCVT